MIRVNRTELLAKAEEWIAALAELDGVVDVETH